MKNSMPINNAIKKLSKKQKDKIDFEKMIKDFKECKKTKGIA